MPCPELHAHRVPADARILETEGPTRTAQEPIGSHGGTPKDGTQNTTAPRPAIDQRAVLMDTNVRDLALIAAIACFGLALAWAHEADFFAICFATAAAVAIVEAARRSV